MILHDILKFRRKSDIIDKLNITKYQLDKIIDDLKAKADISRMQHFIHHFTLYLIDNALDDKQYS